MPSISTVPKGANGSLRVSDVLVKFIQKSESAEKPKQAQVACIREMARHILNLNKDILDVPVRPEQETEITRDFHEFLNGEFGQILSEVEAQAKRESRTVSEADIVKAVPDAKVYEQVQKFRANVFRAVRENAESQSQAQASSTTDSM